MTRANFDNEQRVIASLIIMPSLFDEVADILTAHDFANQFHANVYTAICTMIAAGKPIEIFSIGDYMRLDAAEQASLVMIANSIPTAVGVSHFAQRVKQASIDRQTAIAINTAQKILQEQEENRLDKIQKLFLEISENKASRPLFVKEFSANTLQKLQDRVENKNKLAGLSTGFADLDKLTHGLQNGELIVLAARPSMGKTLLAVNIAENIALESKATVAIFSLEMNKDSLFERMLSSQSRIENEKIQTGNLNNDEQTKIINTFAKLNETKILIDDTSPLTTMQIRAKCRQIKRQHGLALVIVDYLTLLDGDGENETKRVGNISRDLKNIAKELNVPVIAISQLNRNLESRVNKRPVMADLRQSGEIEQDADVIMFIYRDAVYDKNSIYKNVAEIIIAKNRNGSIDAFNLLFHGHICRFDNYFGPPMQKPKPLQQKYTRGFEYADVRD